ncbi:MAG TPA: DUF362 domain-containing protein, partial [Candidatus Hydrogenedentes bacterium]|nr:DUF362 domain-containing protein [Candidatus Hydrogenedentota bacterium]
MKVQKCRTRLLVALGLLAVIWVTAGAYEAVRRLKVGDPTQLVTVGFTSRSSEPTDEDVYAMVDEVIEQTLGPNGLAEIVAPGDKVVIKVNIVHVDLGNEWEPGRAIITDPRVVRHVAELVRDIIGFDAPAELTVVDACFDTGGPSDVGNIRSFAWARLERTDDQNVDPEDYCYDYDADGILDGTSFAQLVNTDAYGQADRYPATVNEPVLGSIDPWYPKFLRTEAEAIAAGEPDTYCDVLIGLPLFKSHGFAGMTGAMKLHYGFRTLDVFLTETGRGSHNAPGYPVNDPANFDNYLCAQHLARTYDFVIMDCLTGNRRGPNLPGGELVNGPCDYILTDAMMASTDSVAIDTVETLFAGYDQSTVEFLQEARLDGLGTDDPAKIRVAGLDAFTIHRNTLYATYNPSGLYPFENGWGGAGVMADFSPPTNVTISDPTLVSGTTYSFDYTADELDGNDLGLARVELLVNGELVGYLNNSPGASGAIEQDMAAFMQGSHACRVAAWDYAFGCSLSTEKTFTAPNSITVTAPSGGAEAEGGQSFDVTWDWTGDMATVWVRLLKNGVHVDYIGRNTSNDGTLTWDVPTGLTADTDYAIQVIHDTGSGYVYDQSEPFAIVQPGITVTAPAGGATLEGGFSYDVTWTSTGTVGPVWVRLLKGGAHVDYIGRNTPNDGLLSWTVPY